MLDAMGVALTADKFELKDICRMLSETPGDCILPADLLIHPPSDKDRLLEVECQSAKALQNSVKGFITQWAIPAVSVWPTLSEATRSLMQKEQEKRLSFFVDRLNALLKKTGENSYTFSPVGALFSDDPADVLEKAFQFFEQNPTVPALLLFSNDGILARRKTDNTAYVPYQSYKPRRLDSLVDSAGAILLVRRQSVDYMRPFLGSRATHLYEAGPQKAGFTSSRFLPNLWTQEQIDNFDRLPTLGRLYRPIRIPLSADMNSRQRQAAFNTGLQEALSVLNGKAPSRIFHDSGPYGLSTNGALLGSAIFDCLPDFDLDNPKFSFDIFSRIGNLGAVSPFAQWVLAMTASGANKDGSLTINLRKQDEATITVVAA